MNHEYIRWKKLFLFCLGIAIASAFCMKWMENDLWVENERFTIIGLEIYYTKEKVIAIFSSINDHVKTILRYHLTFDFAFMAGVYPGIAALCMMARAKRKSAILKRTLFIAALLQLIAWACDVAENYFLFKWLIQKQIGEEFLFYHIIVFFKWFIALTGAFISIPLLLFRRRV